MDRIRSAPPPPLVHELLLLLCLLPTINLPCFVIASRSTLQPQTLPTPVTARTPSEPNTRSCQSARSLLLESSDSVCNGRLINESPMATEHRAEMIVHRTAGREEAREDTLRVRFTPTVVE